MKPKVRRSLAKPRLRIPVTDTQADLGALRSASPAGCVDSGALQPASAPLPPSPAPSTPPLPFSVLYLFAGPERKTDIGSCLRAICKGKRIPINIFELDLCRDPAHDLSNPALWTDILQRLQAAEFDAIILSPPCSSWSRAQYNPQGGPCPLRSAAHLWGFPWLDGVRKEKLVEANELMAKTLQALEAAVATETPFFLEHPEDLGVYRTGLTPASIWRLPELQDLARRAGATRWALHQRKYGAASAKPTGVLSTLPFDSGFGVVGWPTFTATGHYAGPLTKMAAPAMKLGSVNTQPSAAYPHALCMRIAQAIAEHFEVRPKVAKIPAGRVAAFSALERDAELFGPSPVIHPTSSDLAPVMHTSVSVPVLASSPVMPTTSSPPVSTSVPASLPLLSSSSSQMVPATLPMSSSSSSLLGAQLDSKIFGSGQAPVRGDAEQEAVAEIRTLTGGGCCGCL